MVNNTAASKSIRSAVAVQGSTLKALKQKQPMEHRWGVGGGSAAGGRLQ